MKRLSVIISTTEPRTAGALWAKPIEGGFALYMIDEGTCTPLIPVDDNGTPIVDDDEAAIKKLDQKKVNKIVAGTVDNLITIGSNGAIKDSGIKLADLPSGGFVYKSQVNIDTDLPDSGQTVGDQYVVGTAGTYQTETLAVGDFLIWNGTGWDIYKHEHEI